MTSVIASVAGRLKRTAKSFEPRLVEYQRKLKESADCAAQNKRELLKACSESGLPRPHNVLRQLNSGLAVGDCDPDEFFGLLVERLALPEYAELADAIGFTALKEMTEFQERISKMLDVEKMFSSKKNEKPSGSGADSDDADGHVSLGDDDESVEQDFENEPESVTFIKVLFRLIYVSADWNSAIDAAVRVFDESSEDESGVDLGDEDTENDDDDDEEEAEEEEEKEESPKANGVKVEKTKDEDFRPAVDDDEEFERRRDAALDRLLACMDREFFSADAIEQVRQRRAERRSQRESREAEILAAAEAARREQEEAERRRREERKRKREEASADADGEDQKHRRRRKHKHKRRRHRDELPAAEQPLLLAQ